MKHFLLLCIILTSGYALAQSAIRYQGVVYDENNEPLVSTNFRVSFSILTGSLDGTTVYTEEHELMTDEFGGFEAFVGRGVPITNDFGELSWLEDSHFLEVSSDIDGDGLFARIGVSEFLSLPYAFHAAVAHRGLPGPQGPQGPQGLTGPAGPQGNEGPVGDDYPWSGAVGPQGAKGPRGPQGLSGPIGPKGVDGNPNGPKGATGIQGPKGSVGLSGPAGPPGDKGEQGPMGLAGAQGPQGLQGVTGPQGFSGDRGDERGDSGPMGPVGLPVPPGDCSAGVGPIGPPGLAGVDCFDLNGNGIGDASEDINGDGLHDQRDCQGPLGPIGPQGAEGPRGVPGLAFDLILSSPPEAILHSVYLDDGTNREDGRVGFRYYNGQNWIDLY